MLISRSIIIIFVIIFNINFVFGNSITIKVKVHDKIITNIDIESEIKYLLFLNPKLNELENSRLEKIAKNSLITEIIKKKELEKFFDFKKENNLTDLIEKRLLIKKNIKNKNELIEILKKREINYNIIKQKLIIETMWNQLIFQKFSNNIIINKEEMKKNITLQYSKSSKKFNYNLSEIVFDENISKDLETNLLEINNSIKKIGFENTANIYSVSNTANNGGLIGWLSEIQISGQINQNIKDLKVGEISKPIKIQNGYILIRVNDKMELKQEINFEEELEKKIIQEKNRQLNNFSMIYFKRLKKNVEINEN